MAEHEDYPGDQLPREAEHPLPSVEPSTTDPIPDHPGAHTVDQPDPSATEVGTEARRPSVVLLLAGVVALLVSVAALTGLIPWLLENRPDAGVGRWVAVAVVVGVGVLLVAAPMRTKHRQH